MIRDPFYRQIIERLKQPLNRELFEQCAADLLRAIYPTLVPLPGGTDAGMDGAIADGEGEPFPLVCTTAEDVIGNLTKSLKSYLRDGGSRRKVVVATSQQLTPTRVRNLNKRAKELGFVLVNVYIQEAMANLLYRSPKWCQELLDLTGDLPPLSALPQTTRLLLEHTLIGRDADLAWLRDTPGDRLLVGQPGSGKTFLLHKLALEGDSLFVVSGDMGRVAGAVRTEQPRVLIVDDAQIKHRLLADLKHMREVIGADFSLLASCWPSDRDMIAESLNLAGTSIHNVEPLTRDEIVEVVKTVGVQGPDRLVREIVDQAEGRPGLAVTLAYLSLQGGGREVASGDALSRSFVEFFDNAAGRQAKGILAAFSIGGEAGMPMNEVVTALGVRLIDLREAVVRLASGGIVRDVGQDRLSVRPAALRHVLVRDVFFTGAMSLPVESLLAQAPSSLDVARTLIGASARGGDLPRWLLVNTLERAGSEDVWQRFAWLGPDEAKWTLQSHPEKAVTLACPALHWIPGIVIPLLLSAAIGDARPLHSTTEHPLRLIEDWIHAARPGTGQVPERRKILLGSTKAWLSAGGELDVGLRAFQSVLSPKFEYHTTDPGAGDTVTVFFGYPSMDEIHTVQGLWTEVLEVTSENRIENWEPIRNIIEAWAYPGQVNVPISSDMYDGMRAFAGHMLSDIIPIAKDRPSVMHWASQLSAHLGLEIEIPLDPDFEALYPAEDLENWQIAEKRQMLAVRELAEKWSTADPASVVRRVIEIEREAQSTGGVWPRWTPPLCQELAENTASPNSWIRVLIADGVEPDLVAPFLHKAAEIKEPGWIDLALRCLEHPSLKGAAISVALTLPDPPEELLAEVLQKLSGFAQLVQTYCIRNQIPEPLVKRLLGHEDPAIASAAALGEWSAKPKGIVRESLQLAWRDAVINVINEDYRLGEILKADPSLAYNWLQARILEEYPALFRYERAIKAAVDALDIEAKRSILRQLPERYEVAELAVRLVGEDLALYHELLSTQRLRSLHLIPLAGDLEGAWIDKAKLAVQAGYEPHEVAGAVYGYPMSVAVLSGKESARWAEWIERWTRLCSHEDEQLREVGEIGRGYAQACYEEALKRERDEAVYGSDWDRI